MKTVWGMFVGFMIFPVILAIAIGLGFLLYNIDIGVRGRDALAGAWLFVGVLLIMVVLAVRFTP